MIALGPLAIDAYLPSFPLIATAMGVNAVEVGFSLSAYLFGMAIGQMFGGPISDQIGRKRVAITGLTLFFLMSVLILFVGSLTQLIIARVLQAIGGGMAGAVVMPTLRDLSRPEQVAGRIAIVYLIMLGAPLIAPILGVVFMQFGWRWIFGFLCVYALIMLAIYLSHIPETGGSRNKKVEFKRIVSQYLFVMCHRTDGARYPIRYGLSAALTGSIMLIYVTNASFIFQTYFGVADSVFPLFFGANVIGLAIVQSFSARYLRDRNLDEVAGYFRFGQRVQLVMVSALAAVVVFTDISLWVFVPLMICCLSSIGINGSAGSGLFVAAFKAHSGSASALLTTMMFFFGAGLGILSGVFNQGDLTSVVGMLLLATLAGNLVMMTIPRNREKKILGKLQSGEIEAA
jgi:DHA1 family bicyclomycin/chloramphenicol resistance-like MFS transporter